MCGSEESAAASWKGWIDIPESEVCGHGPWVDLSHPLGNAMPRGGAIPAPRFQLWRSLPEGKMNVTEMQMVVHQGTHIDAPRHFIADGPAIDQIPLARLSGPGVVWRFAMAPHQVIEPADLERRTPRLRRGDILILDTGWSERIGSADYLRQPSLSAASAGWLVEQGIKLLAVDCASPEAASERRWQGWRWPVHHLLLSQGVLVAEHLRNLRALGAGRIEAMFLGLNIENSDGAPARVVARPLAA